jgi:hypothetical protein
VKEITSNRPNRYFERSTYISMLIGCVFGIYFIGLRNVLPWNTNWLSGKGDASADQLMWSFFQQTPFFQWPISAMPNYIKGADVIFPTGNILVSVGAKFVGLFIPGQFQYFGVELLTWFVLQALFAERLISRLVSSETFRVCGSLLFLLSPAFIYRIGSMEHFHVGAHWLILAALYLYFDNVVRIKFWAFLIAIAIAVNLYLSVIVIMVFIALLGREFMKIGNDGFLWKLYKVGKISILPLMSGIVSFVLSGFMTYKNSAGGSGLFRLNLMAYFNPGFSATESFSYLLNNMAPISVRHLLAEEAEGYQYLGLGVICAIPILLFAVLKRRGGLRISTWIPLVIASTILFIVALSNNVTFAHNELNYWWPNLLIRFHQIFRGASRFGFLLYYLITLGSILSIWHIFSKKRATFILAVLLVVSVIDLSPGVFKAHQHLAMESTFNSVIKDSQWNLVAKNRTKLLIDKNFDFQSEGETPAAARVFSENWFSLAQFAVDHSMSINFGYAGRPINVFVKAEDIRVAKELSSGNLDRSAIYLISNENDWFRYRDLIGNEGRALKLDGFFVIVSQ